MAYTLPAEPHFRTLLSNVQNSPDHIIVHDAKYGITATYTRFIHDVVTFREELREIFGRGTIDDDGMMYEEKPYVLIMGPASYYFLVGMYAVLALGGAPAVISPAILPEEAIHMAKKCHSEFILYSPENINTITTTLNQTDTIQAIQIKTTTLTTTTPLLNPLSITINSNHTFTPTHPRFLAFTSGSTGPPKGVVHTSRFLNTPNTDLGGDSDDVFLWHLPVHWIGGIFPTIHYLLTGTRLEILPSGNGAGEIWEKLREGVVTILVAGSVGWSLWVRYYHDVICKMHKNSGEREEYERGAGRVRIAVGGAGVVVSRVYETWRELMGGMVNLYTSTEMGGVGVSAGGAREGVRERCIGRPHGSLDMKLSEGDRGEILVKGGTVFDRYLDDPEKTAAAFDEDRYFRTGDAAHLEDGEYVYDGRLNSDFVSYEGFRVPIPETELRLCELPYVREGYILAICDPAVDQHVSALIRLHNTQQQQEDVVSLRTLRQDLQRQHPTMPSSHLPTLLRVLRDDEEVPRSSVSGKILRRQAGEEYFPAISADGVLGEKDEVDTKLDGEDDKKSAKMWDFSGMQR